MNDQPDAVLRRASQARFRPRKERIQYGKSLRGQLSRDAQAHWHPPAHRRDPLAVLEDSNQDRLPELIPIRYGRMIRRPLTFFRGSAPLMAYDLASLPRIGIQVQA
ncbi:MAG: DUF2252 family protein [Synechococcaceae cyanobacterium]|nr:DUF2252 family protein [Synechococcaceae cyanobacterium]